MEVTKVKLKLKQNVRSQAAITDALILLLVSILSSVLVFNFVGEWGQDQDQVLRSSYVLNYMESVSKALYYIDASTLSAIGSDRIKVYEKALVAENDFQDNKRYNLDDDDYGCKQLANYPGTLRVTDLMKRDLADSDPAVGGMPTLNDYFGSAQVPGRTAVRCALKELMKPFAFSGYKYYFEVILSQDAGSIEGGTFDALVRFEGPEITNSKDPQVVGFESVAGGATIKNSNGRGTQVPGCFSLLDKKDFQVLAVSSPFQVLYSDTSKNVLESKFIKYKTRICIWQSTEDLP